MTTAKRWSYSTGTRGVNRVRAFEARSGSLYLEWWEREQGTGHLKRCREMLDHRDRDLAANQAREAAAKFAADPTHGVGEISLGSLFDMYLGEVTPRKAASTQQHDTASAAMFLALWGRRRAVLTLGRREWDRFIDDRREGRVSPAKTPRPVGDRQIEYDLRWLKAVIHWGMHAGVHGNAFLTRDPFASCRAPREQSPARPIITEEQYRKLLGVASEVSWQFELALLLANETGHRIKSIRHLQWRDLDIVHKRIRWRKATDKLRHEHTTPMSKTLRVVLSAARKRAGAIGEAWVLPSPRNPEHPCPKGTLDKWFQNAAARAGGGFAPRAGWHSFRRKFATELQEVLKLKNLAALGGWKDVKTLLVCYQIPDEDEQREALERRRPFGAQTTSIESTSIDDVAV